MAQLKQFKTMAFAPPMLIGVILIGAMSSMAHAAHHHHHQDTSSPASTTRIIQFRDANFSIWNENVKYNSTAMTNPKGKATQCTLITRRVVSYTHVKILIWSHVIYRYGAIVQHHKHGFGLLFGQKTNPRW